MNMQKKIFVIGLLALVAVAGAVPLYAARPIQGAVGEVTTADGAALGTVGFRIWSALPGGTTVFNNNLASCRNVRCIRSFVTNTNLASPGAPGGGGYVGNAEATNAYNADAQDAPFYELADASMADATGNHIGYYGVSGVTANNAGTGQFLTQTCTTTAGQNCFGRIDLAYAQPPLTNTSSSYGGTSTIKAIGGLNPVPNVKVASTGTPGSYLLSWGDPFSYANAMRPSTTAPAPPSPVVGVALYKNDRPTGDCSAPAGNDAGWTKMASHGLGAGVNVPDSVPAGVGCRYYALKVELTGPGGSPAVMESALGVNSQPAKGDATVVRISRFTTTYAGHGKVNVGWTSGVENDTQGYYVTRGLTANGPFQRVSPLVAAKGSNSVYSYTDTPGTTSTTYYYQLQIVGRDGAMATSTPAAVTLPGRTTKVGPKVGK
jgi:hypothetical protein